MTENAISKKEAQRREAAGLTVTMTFPTQALLDEFCAWLCRSGEQGYMQAAEYAEPPGAAGCDYSRCFPAWGWTEGEPQFIDVYTWESGDYP